MIHLVLQAFVDVYAVVHAHPHAEGDHRQGGHLEADAEQGHERIAEDGHQDQRHDHAEHRTPRTEAEPAQQRDGGEDRGQHLHFRLLDSFVGGSRDARVAPTQPEADVGRALLGDEPLHFAGHMLQGRALMVIEVNQQVDSPTAFGVQAQLGVRGTAADAQRRFRALQGGPARIGLVVRRGVQLHATGDRTDRLHAIHSAQAQVESFDGAHHLPVQAGLFQVRGFGIHRQHVHADRVAANDCRVVLVVAGLRPQLGGTEAHIARQQEARVVGPGSQQRRHDGKTGERGSRLREHRHGPPDPMPRARPGRPARHRLQVEVRQDDRQEHLVGDDHQGNAQAGGQSQLMDDRNVDDHDHHETQGVGQQGHGARDGELAEGGLRRLPRRRAGEHVLFPGIGHLHRVGNADGEDQEGHQHRHRVDAVAQQRQQAEQPDHRHQGDAERQGGQLQRTGVEPQQQRGDPERDGEEQDDTQQPVHDLAHDLGEADDPDIDELACMGCPDRLELLRHRRIVEPLAGLRIDLQQVGLDHGRAQVVGHQLADLAGLGNVGADLGEAGRVGFEARGHHDIAGETRLGDFDVTHVGGEQRADAAAVHTRGEEHLIGDLAQNRQELGVVEVARPFPMHADHDAVGAGKGRAVLLERRHVGMRKRDQLVEARVEPGVERRGAEADGQRQEQQAQGQAPGDQAAGQGSDQAIGTGHGDRGRHWGIP
ncbi:hypothetical protein D3C84_492400 [compost metagenome]